MCIGGKALSGKREGRGHQDFRVSVLARGFRGGGGGGATGPSGGRRGGGCRGGGGGGGHEPCSVPRGGKTVVMQGPVHAPRSLQNGFKPSPQAA